MKVKIFKPVRSATQSGRARTTKWVMEYELETPRVPDEKMGWVSSEDTLGQMRITFDTKKEAVAFAEKEGFEYFVLEEKKRKVKPRNYTDNFKFRPEE